MTDIVSLRTLLLSLSELDASLVRQGAGAASLPVDVTHTTQASRATALLDTEEWDLVLIDEGVAQTARDMVIQAAHSAKRVPVTLIQAANPAKPPEITAAAIPDGIIARSEAADIAARMFNRWRRLRRPSRALVVDDSATMRVIVRKILAGSRFPFDIAEAEEGIAALREIGSGRFDVVMLDYNMPGLNGIETLSEIKRLNPGVEVVMITATPDDEIAQRARVAGAAAFLKKPFYSADIDTVMLRLCGVRPLR